LTKTRIYHKKRPKKFQLKKIGGKITRRKREKTKVILNLIAKKWTKRRWIERVKTPYHKTREAAAS